MQFIAVLFSCLEGSTLVYVHLTPYSLRVSELGSSISLPIDSFDGATKLHSKIREYIDDLADGKKVPGRSRAFSVDDVRIHTEGFSLITSYGDYGYGSELRDIDTNDVNYLRKVSDAEMIPLYMRFDFPSGKTKAIMIAQGMEKFGAKTLIADYLTDRFKEEFKSLRLHIMPFLVGQVANTLLKSGEIRSLTYISNEVPRDVSNKVRDGEGGADVKGSYELVVKPAPGEKLQEFRDNLRQVFQGKQKVGGLLEINERRFDDAKIEFQVGKRRRRLKMSDIYSINPEIDISEQVELNGHNHPKRKSVHQITDEMSDEIRESLYGDV